MIHGFAPGKLMEPISTTDMFRDEELPFSLP
jgi:hypothetical protein